MNCGGNEKIGLKKFSKTFSFCKKTNDLDHPPEPVNIGPSAPADVLEQTVRSGADDVHAIFIDHGFGDVDAPLIVDVKSKSFLEKKGG